MSSSSIPRGWCVCWLRERCPSFPPRCLKCHTLPLWFQDSETLVASYSLLHVFYYTLTQSHLVWPLVSLNRCTWSRPLRGRIMKAGPLMGRGWGPVRHIQEVFSFSKLLSNWAVLITPRSPACPSCVLVRPWSPPWGPSAKTSASARSSSRPTRTRENPRCTI